MNFSIVIRGVGERTTDACRALLAEEFPEIPIVVTTGFPLSRGVIAGFEAGITLNHKWTLIVDADTFTLPGTTQKIIEFAEKQQRAFWVQGDVRCKFLGTRQGGNYLYRTELLEMVLPLVEKEMIRPENTVADIMSKKGYRSYYAQGLVTCLHDYEQYYRDIYRKFLVHGVKFRERMTRFQRRAKKSQRRDPDFKVALEASQKGMRLNPRKFVVDASLDFSGEIKRLGLKEKGPLSLKKAKEYVNP